MMIGIVVGIFWGILGASFIIIFWGIAGIARSNVLGCLGPFLTFVFIELPFWCGMPLWTLSLLWRLGYNLIGIEVLTGSFLVSILIFLSLDAVAKVRTYVETNILKR